MPLTKKSLTNMASQFKSKAEGRTTIILYSSVIWMLLIWYFPLFLQYSCGLFWPDREGVYMSFSDVGSFFGAAGALFIIEIIMSLVMLIVVLMTIIFGITNLFKMRKELVQAMITSRTKFAVDSALDNPGVRTFLYVLLFIIMLFISVAGIISITCIDNEVLKDQALVLKFMGGGGVEHKHLTELAAFFRSHHGLKNASSAFFGSDTNTGVFLEDGYLAQHGDGMGIRLVTNATLTKYELLGKIYYNNNTVTRKQIEDMMKNHQLMRVDVHDGGLWFQPVPELKWPKMSEFQSEVALSHMGVSTKDMMNTDSSLYKYMMAYGHDVESSVAHHMLASNHTVLVAMAIAYVEVCKSHMAKNAILFGQSPDIIDADALLDSVAYCDIGLGYAAVMMMGTLTILLGVFIYMICKRNVGKYGSGARDIPYPRPYNQVNDNDDEEDVLYDAAASTWRGEE